MSFNPETKTHFLPSPISQILLPELTDSALEASPLGRLYKILKIVPVPRRPLVIKTVQTLVTSYKESGDARIPLELVTIALKNPWEYVFLISSANKVLRLLKETLSCGSGEELLEQLREINRAEISGTK